LSQGKAQDLTLDGLNQAAARLATASIARLAVVRTALLPESVTALPANLLATKLFAPPAPIWSSARAIELYNSS
jgi:hypothetical protein